MYKPEEFLAKLVDLGIECETKSHDPVFTVEESKKIRSGQTNDGQCKNLFLRDKKKQMWLVTTHEDATIDLGKLVELMGSKNLSFASSERLMQYLGVIPGAVSPLGLVNDSECEVNFWIDSELLKSDMLYFHPLDNSKTTAITPKDLQRFCEAINHPVNELHLS